jgi:hypothetical protein
VVGAGTQQCLEACEFAFLYMGQVFELAHPGLGFGRFGPGPHHPIVGLEHPFLFGPETAAKVVERLAGLGGHG